MPRDMRSANQVILVLLVAVTALSPFLWHEIAAQQQRARSEPVVLAQAARNSDISAIARHLRKYGAAKVPRYKLAEPGGVAKETLRRG